MLVDSVVTLWLNPAVLPKVLSPNFVNQFEFAVLNEDKSEGHSLLCPKIAILRYLNWMVAIQSSDHLFCHGRNT